MKTNSSLSPFMRHLMDGINIPLVVLVASSNKIHYVNTAMEDLLGQERADLIDHDLDKLFAPTSLPKAIALCEVAQSTKEPGELREHELNIIRKSGRLITVNVLASPIRGGRRKFLLLAVHDLSYIKELQARREGNLKELAQVSKLADIGLLAAGVAHELNNPLMIIQGLSENLLFAQKKQAVTDDILKSNIQQILTACDRMGKIISQMSRMVRFGDVRYETKPFAEIVNNVLRFLDHEIRSFNVKIENQIATEHIIKCDQNQIEQVVLNIVRNGIQATAEKPVPQRFLRLTTELHKGQVLLRIWNSGFPIPEHIRDKIMTPFFTTKDVGKGTGLGLAVSYGIVRAHGGSISFVSDEVGTEFSISLPSAAQESQPGESLPRKVLILDDDPVIGDIIGSQFMAFGLTVIKAKDGFDAVKLINADTRIVAAVVGLQMVKMDGISVCRRIRANQLHGPRLYLLAESNVKNLAQEIQALDISAVIHKPLNYDKIALLAQEISSLEDVSIGSARRHSA